MPKKRWVHDGPHQSQGFGHSWEMLQTILRMSRAAAEARKETATLWHFYRDHPECIPTQRDLEHVPPEKFIEQAHDLRRRFEAEQKRRKETLMRTLIIIIVILVPALAHAGTSCTTRKSGSVTITSCSDSWHRSNMRTCRSYRSGSVTKTSCS